MFLIVRQKNLAKSTSLDKGRQVCVGPASGLMALSGRLLITKTQRNLPKEDINNCCRPV